MIDIIKDQFPKPEDVDWDTVQITVDNNIEPYSGISRGRTIKIQYVTKDHHERVTIIRDL